MKFLKFIPLFIFFTGINKISGQTLEWSNTTKIRGNSLYTTVIGEDENGIYILRHRNKLLSKFVVIERYRHNLGFEASKSYLMKNSRILFCDINKKGILIIKLHYLKKSKSYNVVATYLNSSFEPIVSEQILMKLNNNDRYSEPKVLLRYDENHENYLLLNASNLSTKNKNFEFMIFDLNLETKISRNVLIDKNYKFDKINEVLFDEKFNLYILAEHRKPENTYSDYYLLENKSEKLRIELISDSNYIYDKMQIIYNKILKCVVITGFYTSSFKSGYEGQFWSKFLDSIKIIKTPFSNEILKETEKDINAQYGFIPKSYKPLKIVKCTNGGIIKVIENTIVNKDQEIMMINGNTTSHGKYVYIYENLIIQSFDSSGNLVWEHNVNKTQSSINDGGMLGSVFISNTQNKINILYNDPITNGGDVILASFNATGKKSSNKIIDGNLYNALIIPEEAKQISGNKIIVPVIKERKFALLKIQF